MMSDVSLSNNLPSQGRLKAISRLGWVIYTVGLAGFGTLLLIGMWHGMEGGTMSPWWQWSIVPAVFAVIGVVLTLVFGRKRERLYSQVPSGVIDKVDTSYSGGTGYNTYIVVKGENRAGQVTEQRVYLHPNNWRKLNVGDHYPQPQP